MLVHIYPLLRKHVHSSCGAAAVGWATERQTKATPECRRRHRRNPSPSITIHRHPHHPSPSAAIHPFIAIHLHPSPSITTNLHPHPPPSLSISIPTNLHPHQSPSIAINRHRSPSIARLAVIGASNQLSHWNGPTDRWTDGQTEGRLSIPPPGLQLLAGLKASGGSDPRRSSHSPPLIPQTDRRLALPTVLGFV